MNEFGGLDETVAELLKRLSSRPKRIRQKCDDDEELYWSAPDGANVTITVHNTGDCEMKATFAQRGGGGFTLTVQSGQSKSASGVFTGLTIECAKADEGKCRGTYEIE